MNIAQFLLILRARYKLILTTLSISVLTTLVVSVLLPKSYTATTTLVLNYKGMDPITGVAIPAQLMPGYMATQVDIITSHHVAAKVVDQFGFARNPTAIEQFNEETDGKGDIRDWFADVLLKKLEVEPSRESSVIAISFSGADPEFAASVANAFAVAYKQTNLQLKIEPSQSAATYLGGQTESLRKKLEEAQARLSAYQQDKGLTSAFEQLDIETAKLNDLAAQLAIAQSQAIEAASRHFGTRANTDESPDIASNPIVQGLKIDLARAESKLAELSQRLDRNHPQMQSAQAEVEKLRSQLQEEIRRASASVGGSARIYRQREAELRAALSAQKSRVLELNRSRDQLAVLQKDVESAQRALDAVSQRFTQNSLESESSQTEVAILNPAVPPQEASSPRVMLNMLLSIFLGGMLGIGFGLLAEMLDRRVRSADDITQAFGIPVFAIVRKQSQKPLRVRLPLWMGRMRSAT